MKNSILFLLSIIIISFSLFSCGDKYKMPYEPGIHVDKDALMEHEALWNRNEIINYKYTCKWENYTYPDSFIAEITVSNRLVTECLLKKYNGKEKSNCTNDEWENYETRFKNNHAAETFLIEGLYNQIDETIDDFYRLYNESSDKVYSKVDFVFSDSLPYLKSCELFYLFMDKDADGNFSNIKIFINDFEEI